jgi:hypothetical protein
VRNLRGAKTRCTTVAEVLNDTIVLSIGFETSGLMPRCSVVSGLRSARAQVVRLERELHEEPAQSEDSTYVPEILRSVNIQQPRHLPGGSVLLIVA